MRIRALHALAIVLGAVSVTDAAAARCDAYFPFDGSLADRSGNGYGGLMISQEGNPGAPRFVEGRFGEALHVTGGSAMRAFLDLHYDACPQFTITAWFQLPSVGHDGSQYIVSTGSRGGTPAIRVDGRTLRLSGQGNGLMQRDAIRDGNSWFFVAATFDYPAQTYKLYWRNRSQEGRLSESSYEPEDSLWIGTRDDKMYGTAQSLYVDELRVFGRVLELDEIRGVSMNRESTSTEPAAVATILQGPADTSGLDPGLSMPEDTRTGSFEGIIPTGQSTGAPGATNDPLTVEDVRQSAAERNPLSEASREAIEERAAANRPPNLTSGSGTESGSNQQSETGTGSSPPETTIPHPAGTKRYSAVSGRRGDIVRELELYFPAMRVQGIFDKAWLTGISWQENRDRPCWVRIDGLRPIEYSNGRVHEQWDDDEELAGCSGGDWIFTQGPGTVSLSQRSPSPLAGGDASVIGRIQVCHNDRSNRRIKGLRITGSRIRSDGTVTSEGNSDATEFPNCRSWSPAVICPANTLGTGLVIHATEAGALQGSERFRLTTYPEFLYRVIRFRYKAIVTSNCGAMPTRQAASKGAN